jgi:transcriptional regulator GlxA family with amidase domain
VLHTAAQLGTRDDGPSPVLEVERYGPGGAVASRLGLRTATRPWDELTENPPDVLVLPALGLPSPDEITRTVHDHPLLPVVRELAAAGVHVAAACSGTFFLGEAGLLDGRAATTSWWLASTFRLRYPQVDLHDGSSLVSDHRVTTAGAAFSRYLVVGQRPQQGAVSMPSVLVGSDPTLIAFERHVRERMAHADAISDIAHAIGTSERTLQRLTSDVLGMSPLRFVQQMRAERARQLLRTTELSTQRVAEAVGYRHASSLRSLLRRSDDAAA